MRRALVAGNWKMHGTRASVAELIEELRQLELPAEVEVAVFPGSLHIAQVVAGLVAGAWYVWHSRQVTYPIIDLSLLRTKTFAISVLGGNLCRFSLGAAPFLLAIMLQTNFGMSAATLQPRPNGCENR